MRARNCSSPQPCQGFPCSPGTLRAMGMCPRVPFSLGTQTGLPGAIRLALELCHCGGTPLLPGGTHHQGLLLLSSSPHFGARHHLRPCPQPRRGHSWGPAEQPSLCASASSATVIKSECCLPANSPGEKKPAPGRSRGAASRVRSARKGLQTEGAVSDSSRAWEKCPAFRSRPISVSAPASRASEPRVGSAVPAPGGFARGWGARNTPAWLWGGCG